MVHETPRRKQSLTTRVLPKAIYLLIIVALAVFGGLYFKKYNDLRNSSPEQVVQKQQDEVIAEIAKLYKLPTNEKPQYATVNDKESLKKQNSFFDQVENNDVVLIYQKAGLAIVYRPSSKQLVKVGPVNIQSTAVIKVVGPQADRQAAVQKLTAAQIASTDGGDAKGAYAGITVVDLKGNNSDQTKKVAEVLGGQVGTLPAGETAPADTDILVLTGSAAL